MTQMQTTTKSTRRHGWTAAIVILGVIGAIWVFHGVGGQDDSRLAGTWSAQWTIRNPGANPFTPQLGAPQTLTVTIEENLEFSPISSQTNEGGFSLAHYQDGQLSYRVDGGYRFWTNSLLGSTDAKQLQFKGVDNQGLQKSWAMVLVSLTPSTMVLKGLYSGEQITYHKVR